MRHGTEPVAILPEVAVGFLRVVTNQRIFKSPETLVTADQGFGRFPALRTRLIVTPCLVQGK